MSSFLTAAQNAARQRQNVRCGFKNKMGEESTSAVEPALEGHSLVISGQKHIIQTLTHQRSGSDLKIIDRFSIASCFIGFTKHKRRVRKQRVGNRFEFFDFNLPKETFQRN